MHQNNKKLDLGIVVGEASGENLGAPLISALKKHCLDPSFSGTYADVNFSGILGPQLIEEGGDAWFPMERLSVVGLTEPLLRLPELYRIRQTLIKRFINHPPDVFLGIDAPDFNLGLEVKLRAKGIPVVHYVSPTVWAWRRGRIHTIKKGVDLMLTLFPFEAQFYKEHKVPVCFAGHPLADEIPMHIDSVAAKQALGVSENQTVVALFPGSRDRELVTLGECYLKTAAWCYKQCKDLVFVTSLLNEKHKAILEALQKKWAPELPLTILLKDARRAMAACDVALVKAGTSTLEVMLHKKPMVVSYRLNPISFQILKYLVTVPYIALPNLLAAEKLVPEFIQKDVKPEIMGRALLDLLDKNSNENSHRINRFTELHQILRRNASETAAKAILELVNPHL